MAGKKFVKEFPFPARVLTERYQRLEKIPFNLQMGGKVLNIVVGDGEDMYLVYDLQQQVIFGVEGMNQAEMVARLQAILAELWPTSVLEIKNPKAYKKTVLAGILDWAIEYGELTKEQQGKAIELRQLFK